MKPKDTLIVSLSDMHSGSNRSLFPDWEVYTEPTASDEGDDETHPMTGSLKQKQIFKHFDQCAEQVKKLSANKRLIVVHNGDAIEGIHHTTIQVMSPNVKDHVKIHIELMEYFLQKCGFSPKRGDELHYVSGTESHTNYDEMKITKHFDHINAKYYDELKMTVNGKTVWYTHHGGSAGDGASEGDGYRNWLKRIYFNNLKQSKKQPDIIFTGHVHKPIYTSYVQDYHTIHGVILPSWQMKTRYAYRAAPFQRNDIGMTMTEITEGGDIRVMKPLIMEM